MKFVEVRRDFISPEMREYILKRDKYSCRYCGAKNVQFHLDHVYPASKGGETSYLNLVTSCASCNLWKHNKVGVYPKPIGYFEDKESMEFSKVIYQCVPMAVSMFLLCLSVSDSLHGIREYIGIQVILALFVSLPIFIDTIIKDFRRMFR